MQNDLDSSNIKVVININKLTIFEAVWLEFCVLISSYVCYLYDDNSIKLLKQTENFW